MNLSPYELLRMSVPRSPSAPTPYDLYSSMQQNAACKAEPMQTSEPASFPPSPPLLPEKRTHYISDIHARHNAAGKRSVSFQSPAP